MNEDETDGDEATQVLPGFPFSAAPANDEAPGKSRTAAIRLSAARRIFQSRLIRLQAFDAAMFGEPAWDMLLSLYIQHAVGCQPTRANLAHSVHVPGSVAVRWQDYLLRLGLVELANCPQGGAVRLQLSSNGRDALEHYLSQVGGA